MMRRQKVQEDSIMNQVRQLLLRSKVEFTSVNHVSITPLHIQKYTVPLKNHLVANRKFWCPFLSHPIVKAELPQRRDVFHRKQHQVGKH